MISIYVIYKGYFLTKRIKISNKRKLSGYSPSIQRFNNILLSNLSVKEEIPKKIRQYFKQNENDRVAYQNFQDAPKGRFWGKFVMVIAYVTKDEMSQISNLSFHLRD